MSTLGDRLGLMFRVLGEGPSILLIGELSADFSRLHAVFQSLSQRHQQLDLHELPFVVTWQPLQLTAISGPDPNASWTRGAALGVRQRSERVLHFIWRADPDDWAWMAEMIEPVVQSATPCHQYLGLDAAEDAEVMVSKGEYCWEDLQPR